MRCPDCNKFVSYDEPQVEEQNMDVEGNEIVGEVRVVLPCAECGTELKEHSFEVYESFDHECDEETLVAYRAQLASEGESYEYEGDEDPDFELESSDNWNAEDRYEDKDSKGKPIKNPRYQKHFYGFSGTVSVKCLKCGEVFEVEVSGEEQASAYDECC